MTRDEVRLHHMIDAGNQAMRFLAERNQGDLKIDPMLALAVIKSLEIMGEAARHLSDGCKRRLPDVSWHKIVGLRHRLVHDYSKINTAVVWHITRDDVPQLVAQLESLLAQIASPDGK